MRKELESSGFRKHDRASELNPKRSGQMKHGSRPPQVSPSNASPIKRTRSQQNAYQEALNRERSQKGQYRLSTLDIIAGKGALPTPKTTDLSMLPQSQPDFRGYENGPTVSNPSTNVRSLTLKDYYNEQKKEFETAFQNQVRGIFKEVVDVVSDPITATEFGMAAIERAKNVPSLLRSAAERARKGMPAVPVLIGAYDGYKGIKPTDTSGKKISRVVAEVAKKADNALVAVGTGMLTAPFATPVGGVAAGLATKRVYDKSGLNSIVDRGVDFVEPYVADTIDFLDPYVGDAIDVLNPINTYAAITDPAALKSRLRNNRFWAYLDTSLSLKTDLTQPHKHS